MTDDCWLAKTLTQISAQWYSWQTWLISVHYSQKTLHFLTVSSGPTSVLSDILITLRKPHEIIFVGRIFYNLWFLMTCELCFWDVSEGGVTEKTSFLRYFWDVLKALQKRHLFWDVFETFQGRHKKSSLLRCLQGVTEMSLSMEIWLRSLRDIFCPLGRWLCINFLWVNFRSNCFLGHWDRQQQRI